MSSTSRMEQISRRLRAPAKEGQQYQTGWFYERARGQWENDRAARGPAGEQAKFELEYPKSQRITKTDWAKYDYCWNQHPDLVSKGRSIRLRRLCEQGRSAVDERRWQRS